MNDELDLLLRETSLDETTNKKQVDRNPSYGVNNDIDHTFRFARKVGRSSLGATGGAILGNKLGLPEEQGVYHSKHRANRFSEKNVHSHGEKKERGTIFDDDEWNFDMLLDEDEGYGLDENSGKNRSSDTFEIVSPPAREKKKANDAFDVSLDALLDLTEDFDAPAMSSRKLEESTESIKKELSAGFGRFHWSDSDNEENSTNVQNSEIIEEDPESSDMELPSAAAEALAAAASSLLDPEVAKDDGATENSSSAKDSTSSKSSSPVKSLKEAGNVVKDMVQEAKKSASGKQIVKLELKPDAPLFALLRQLPGGKGGYISGFRPKNKGGSPAQDAGVHLGMVLVSVNGIDLTDMNISELTTFMREKSSEKRTILFGPPPDGFDLNKHQSKKKKKKEKSWPSADAMREMSKKAQQNGKSSPKLSLAVPRKLTSDTSEKSSSWWSPWKDLLIEDIKSDKTKAIRRWTTYFKDIGKIKGTMKMSVMLKKSAKAAKNLVKADLITAKSVSAATSALMAPIQDILSIARGVDEEEDSIDSGKRSLLSADISDIFKRCMFAVKKWQNKQTVPWHDGVDDGPAFAARISAVEALHMAAELTLHTDSFDTTEQMEAAEDTLLCHPLNEFVRIFAPTLLSDRGLGCRSAASFRTIQRSLFSYMSTGGTNDGAAAAASEESFTVEVLPRLLDFVSKGVLFAIQLCSSGGPKEGLQEGEELGAGSLDGQDNENELISIVCDRENVFNDFVDSLHRHGVLTDRCRVLRRTPGTLELQLYFKSSFGKKRIDGMLVEEGEGSGPRKEFFALASAECVRTWTSYKKISGLVSLDGEGSLILKGNDDTHFTKEIQGRDRLRIYSSSRSKIYNVEVQSVENDNTLKLAAVDLESIGILKDAVAEQSRKITPLLRYVQSCECFWLNPAVEKTAENFLRYISLGVLLAMTISSRATMNINLPILLFRHLLGGPTQSAKVFKASIGFDEILEFDPEAAGRIAKAISLPQNQFRQMCELESLPPITTREVYAQHCAKEVLLGDVEWQLDGIAHGFHKSLGPVDDIYRRLHLSSRELKCIVCGIQANPDMDFDFHEVFRVVEDEELTAKENAPLREAFWSIMNGFSPRKKRQFLYFCTGVKTLPMPGTESLSIEMPFTAYGVDEHKDLLCKLPSAHTCSNTLELPNYFSSLKAVNESQSGDELKKELVQLVERKLIQSIENAKGYGLDEIRD